MRYYVLQLKKQYHDLLYRNMRNRKLLPVVEALIEKAEAGELNSLRSVA